MPMLSCPDLVAFKAEPLSDAVVLGAIATMQGIGASLSGLAAGVIVDHFGYSVAFLALGAAAAVALIVFALGMPETAEPETVSLRS
jgi:MFS family permease